MNSKPKRLFVVDAMAMAFRNFHAFGARPLTTSAGLPTSSVYGSAQFLWKLIDEEKPDFLAIATDSREPTFRHKMYPQYKANRKQMPEDLATQLPYLFRLFEALECPLLKEGGLEADDLIGSLVTQYASEDLHCYIVSGDKDFMQLIGPKTSLYTPLKGGEIKHVGTDQVIERFGCQPPQVIDVLALMGDSSDNVPGVPGIGEKGAIKLVGEYGNLDGILDNADQISNKKQRENLKEHRDLAVLSRKLVTIQTDAKLSCTLESLKCNPNTALTNKNVQELFHELEFTNLEKRIQKKLGSEPQPAANVEPQPEAAEPTADLNYTLVDNTAKLESLKTELKKSQYYSFDSETTGLNIINDTPIGFSFATSPGVAYYLPCVDVHLQADLSSDAVFDFLKEVLADSKTTKIGHNLKYDMHMLQNLGISIPLPFVDTMMCSYLLEANLKSHGLDSCCLKHLNYQKIPTSDLIGKKGEIPMLEVPLEKLTHYACEDADFTLRLYEYFMPRIEAEHLTKVLTEIEMPLLSILQRMEHTGTYIDLDILQGLSKRLTAQVRELETKIYSLAGEEFNINSTKKLQEILFVKLKLQDELGIKRLKKTKTGFSTDVSVLERLSEHPLPRAILDYRTVTKLKNTYVDALPKIINEKTGRVHTSFHQTGAATGRLSSSDPNLQNIPIRSSAGKEIRKAFCASKQDWQMISADYSQVELRILAHLSKDPGLTSAFAEGEDIHRSTAAKIFGVSPADVTDDQRSAAKAINFGIIYGMGPNRLAKQTGVSFAEAKQFIEKYFQGYPKIREYIDQSIESARRLGYTETMIGRRRPIPELRSRDRMVLANAENIAVNSPIQGSAADLIKIAMIKIDDEFRRQKLAARMLIQVHDELVFEAAAADVPAATKLIKDSMENAFQLNVPVTVEVGAGSNWLEAH